MTKEQDAPDAAVAVMAGWMICIIMLAKGPFLEGRRHAWNTIAIPLASWFLIDTVFSIAHGVWSNVLLKTATGHDRPESAVTMIGIRSVPF